MAHFKSSRPKSAPKAAKVRCAICGAQRIPQRMRREPPERGEWCCPGDCRETKRKRNQDE